MEQILDIRMWQSVLETRHAKEKRSTVRIWDLVNLGKQLALSAFIYDVHANPAKPK